MADTISTIGAVTSVVGAATGVAQTFFQGKEIFGVPLVNVEEIRDDLNEAIRELGSVRTDFENEVKKNKTRVRSRKYVEWLQRVKETEDKVRDLIDRYGNQSNERGWFQFYSPRRDFRKDMKRMHEKVINLCQESKEIRGKILVDRAPETIVKRKGPDIRIYGTLQKPLEKILEWLKIYNIKRIGIYGTVGIGKTTIMSNLNDHDQVAKMFDIVIWLKVSKEEGKENLSREHLQHDIASRLKLTMAGTSNADEVAQRIATELEGKKYLLLLDDVKEYLNLPEIGIPDSNNCSKIVLTTRLRLVSNSMADKEIKAAYLSPDEAWKMFKNVLGNEDFIKDPKIARLAYKVCKECGGLPLLIKKVASAFKLKNSEILWSDGWNSWMMWPRKECEGIREIYELLRFCYNDLEDGRYQKCFLYSALYPEDSDINTVSLLECWEAEDLLIHENDGRKKRVMAGVSILNHLKNVSLIEEGKRDHVTMNQFIRQVALYISGEDHPECKLLVEINTKLREPPDETSWIDKNRISLGASELDKLPDSPNCSMLSTLFLQANKGLEIIPLAFFNHMIKLRVLDLSDTGIKSLPSSLQILSKLKVLHLNNCKKLKELPSHIDGLEDLEFLDIHGSGINGIPLDIKKLKLLKHLWVSFGSGNDAEGVSFNYKMISELSELEELVIDFESLQQWTNEVENIMEEVAKLEKFKKLRVCLPEMIVDVIEVVAPKTVLINVPEAKTLLSYIEGSSWKEVRKISSFQFFIGLKNGGYCQHPNFVTYEKYVKYCNGVVSNTPDPILKVLAEAEGFELVNHKDIKQLSEFGTAKMNNIQGFLIESCVAIETIMDTVGSELLPNLEELFIRNLPVLKSIWKGPLQRESLTKLTKLVVFNCRDLVKVFPSGVIKNLRQIQYLKFEKCHGVKEIIPEVDAIVEERIPGVDAMVEERIPEVDDAIVEEIIPEVDAIENTELPNLKELILLDMTQLSCISAIESLECPSLEKLEIFGCPELRKLPFNKDNVKILKCINAEKEWWGELQFQKEEDKEVLQELCSFEIAQRSHCLKRKQSLTSF